MFQINRLRCSSSGIVSLICRNSNASSLQLASQQRTFLCRSTTGSTLFRSNHTIATAINTSRRTLSQPQPLKKLTAAKKCKFSTSSSSSPSAPSWLEGDIGALGTKVYHTLNIGLAVMVPLYFLTPERYSNGYINKTVGFFMATGISLHSYIGLNYVCRDYVPKLSSKLLGPARIVTAAFSLIMFLGMSKIALYSPNGIKGVITGLWTSSKKVEETK
jgi:succinate dehydrogenase hydrophobic anchor subunit